MEVEERGSNPNSLIGNLAFPFGLKDFSAFFFGVVFLGAIFGRKFIIIRLPSCFVDDLRLSFPSMKHTRLNYFPHGLVQLLKLRFDWNFNFP